MRQVSTPSSYSDNSDPLCILRQGTGRHLRGKRKSEKKRTGRKDKTNRAYLLKEMRRDKRQHRACALSEYNRNSGGEMSSLQGEGRGGRG